MRLLRKIEDLASFREGVVATIGNFDGVHLGHQHLIRLLRQEADAKQLSLVLFLFEPQPLEYFKKTAAPVRLSSLREKWDILASCGVDAVVCLRFNQTMAETSAEDFAKQYLFALKKVQHLIVGRDFRFGKNREGDASLLQKLAENQDCKLSISEDYCINAEKISSTSIRLFLQQGQLQKAAQYLGRPYSMCGRVIQGQGLGRQWGIPTANLALRREPPLLGVFLVGVRIEGKWVHGVANVGTRPTVDGLKKSLEVHLFDFNTQIYGKHIQVNFLDKLRNETKFPTLDALIAQIRADITQARARLNRSVVPRLVRGI